MQANYTVVAVESIHACLLFVNLLVLQNSILNMLSCFSLTITLDISFKLTQFDCDV